MDKIEQEEQEFKILDEGISPEFRMGLLGKDSCCGGRA
ncbi:hypothetical protein C5S29_09745 [ANME-1 cluster archaeon GoMg3.2]|jgi:hypothetical protein|nr:hypothetical protein [ANME-1 cluster archaeon GoMg3.2]